jgi:hypothetical protein
MTAIIRQRQIRTNTIFWLFQISNQLERELLKIAKKIMLCMSRLW